jgi:glycogen debranching enzyme
MARALRPTEHKTRERILTHADPAQVLKTTEAIVLKAGSLFMLATDSGDVPFEGPHGYGLYFRDCRFLDGYTLRVNGAAPTVLAASADRAFRTRHHLTTGTLRRHERVVVPRQTLAILRERTVRDDIVHERTTVRNYGRERLSVTLELAFRARFEDLFEVRGFVKGPRGRRRRPVVRGHTVELAYAGRDGLTRFTRLAFAPTPARLTPRRATFTLTLAPGAERDVEVVITPCEVRAGRRAGRAPCPPMPRAALHRGPARAEAEWLAVTADVRCSSPLFERVFHRARLDLHMLRSRLEGHDYCAAGVPWFGTLFGRDAAIVAIQILPYGPTIARDTLRLLARYQARERDGFRDAEPGKILHEYREGELAHLGAVPQSPAYYGTVDATALFLILLAEYVRWSGDLDLARQLTDHVDAALGWIERAMEEGEGYLVYRGRYPNGLINQGWKDSGNAIVNADGSLPEPPIALCEVQGYAFRAWRQTAVVRRALGDRAGAEALEQRAEALRARFERDFWDEALGCYVLARQAGGRPAAVVSSNTGQVLWSGIADAARGARIASRLLEPDMFSGWGVRTLSAHAAAYNPMSYHLGSVWPHDNGIIVSGLRRYGLDEPALRIFDGMFEAATRFRDFRLPELFCGYPRSDGENEPVRYPVACSPQAWAAGSLPHALWNLLGLRAEATACTLHVIRPRLPTGISELALDGVVVGQARVDLRFRRRDAGGAAGVDAHVRAGELTVRVSDARPAPTMFEGPAEADRAA